jgi:hypothetical protein
VKGRSCNETEIPANGLDDVPSYNYVGGCHFGNYGRAVGILVLIVVKQCGVVAPDSHGWELVVEECAQK